MSNHMIFSPSILSADFTKLGQEISDAVRAGAQYLHIDVMDGLFVPSISFGMPVIRSIRKVTEIPFDVHLMIQDPIRYIEDFADAGADIIGFHLEAAKDPQAVIDAIRARGRRVSITINPETRLEEVLPWLDKVDQLLIMSVHPGFGGQKYIPESTDKIRRARAYIEDKGLSCDLEVDGGVKLSNLEEVLEAGCNVIVAGSAAFGADTYGNTKEFVGRLNAFVGHRH